MKKKNLLKDAVALGGIIVVLIVFFYKFIFMGLIPINADWLVKTFEPWKTLSSTVNLSHFNADIDPVLYMYPIKHVTIEIMKKGILPLWNPYILCGAPLWGNNLATPLNPLNIVFFIFDFMHAWGIFFILQFAVAGIFMYLFCREAGTGRIGSGIAGIAYMLNMTFVLWFQIASFLGTYAWLPMVFFLIEKAFNRKSYILASWCGLGFALFFWCGFIQTAVYSALITGVYLVFKYITCIRSDRSAIKRYTILVLVIVMAASIYMTPELIMQRTNIVNSMRTLNHYSHGNFMYPQMLVTYLSPYFYGTKYDGWDVGYGTYIFYRGLLRLSPPYVGLLTLLLAAIGFITRRQKDKYFYLTFSAGMLAAFLLLIAPFIYKLAIRAMPAFDAVDQYRSMTLFAFSIAVMAGWGTDALLAPDQNKKLLRRISIVFCSIVIGIFIFINFASYIDPQKMVSSLSLSGAGAAGFAADKSHNMKSVYKFVEYLNMLRGSGKTLLFSKEAFLPISFAMLSLVLVLGALKVRKKHIIAAIMFLFIAADLLYYGLVYPAYSYAANVFPSVGSSKFLSADAPDFRVIAYTKNKELTQGNVYPPNTAIMYGLRDIRGYENIGLTKWYYRFISGDKEGSDSPYIFNSYENKFISFMNVKYLMSDSEIRSDIWSLVYDKEIKIYRNDKVMPRAFVTKNVRYADDEDRAFALAREDSFDPSTEVILESRDAGDLRADPIGKNDMIFPEITKSSPNEIIVKLDGATSGVLVLSEAYFPGWRTFVDGKERKVLKANCAFRAVYVHKGDNFVRFLFRPAVFYGALYINALLFVSMLAFSCVCMIRRRVL